MTTKKITACAQPLKEAPYLLMKAIKRGQVKWVKRSPLYMELNVTDVGAAAWEAVFELDPQTRVRFLKVPYLKRLSTDTEQTNWHLSFTGSQFVLDLFSRRYISHGNDPSAFVIIMRMSAETAVIRQFYEGVLASLGRSPTEFTDLDALVSLLNTNAAAIARPWALFGVQTGTVDVDHDERVRTLEQKIGGALDEFKNRCPNSALVSKFRILIEKYVHGPLQAGELEKAEGNAGPLLEKIAAIEKSFETAGKIIESSKSKLYSYSEAGADISTATALIDEAEDALAKLDETRLKKTLLAVKRSLADLAASASAAAAAPAASAPAPPKKRLMSFDMALMEGADEAGASAEARPPIEEIATFVICKICGETLGDAPIIQCAECGKRYHENCAATHARCLVCRSALAPEGDHGTRGGAADALDVLASAPAPTPATCTTEIETAERKQFAMQRKITDFVLCGVCGCVLGERPLVQCPECGKRYHMGCADGVNRCLTCRRAFEDGLPPVDREAVDEAMTMAAPATGDGAAASVGDGLTENGLVDVDAFVGDLLSDLDIPEEEL